MYLSRLYIKNFRSIKEVDISFSENKNVIIGRNNSGKSNIIAALDAVLSESSPTYHRTQNITESDFHSWKETDENGELHVRKEDELFIWCELSRHANESLNYEAMYKDYSLPVLANKPRYGDPELLYGRSLPEDYQEIFDLTEENSDTTWISTKSPHSKELQKIFRDQNYFAYAFRARLDGVQVFKDIRFLFRSSEQSSWYLGFKAKFRNQLLQSAIIPPFRDPGGQLRATHYSWYGKLVKHLTDKHVDRDRLDDAFAAVKKEADQVFDSMRREVASSVLEVAFPDSKLHFQFNPDAGPDLYKNAEIYVDDGVKSKLTEKGSGIQSATIIGLFNYYTKNVNTDSSALLCIEEPELFLHPHARRVISKRLDDFLQSGDSHNQVILTTHSVDFIRAAKRDLTVILVRKGQTGTTAQAVPISRFKQLLIDNNQNELFFADKVILCEGYDKYVVEAVADDMFAGSLDKRNVSVVQVGGKDRLCQLARLVIDLGIECYILADFDFLLRDKLDARKKYGAKAHSSIENLGKDFLSQSCIFGNNGNKALSRISKIRNELKDVDEKGFYTAKSVSDLRDSESKDRIIDKVIPKLQENGLGILTCEIEDFFTKRKVLNSGKLNLDSVYNMNDIRNEGASVKDILDTSEIQTFLSAVLDV